MYLISGFGHQIGRVGNTGQNARDNGPANDRSWTTIYFCLFFLANGIVKKFADCPQEMNLTQ